MTPASARLPLVLAASLVGGTLPSAQAPCTTELAPKLPALGTYSASQLALGGEVALIGDPGSAAVFVYRATLDAPPQTVLVSDDVGSDDSFGAAVAIEGDVAAVGAPNTDDGTGAVYVFRSAGGAWRQEQVLVPDSPGRFGWSIDIDGDALLVGAWGENAGPGLLDTGAAYVFRHDGSSWEKEQKLTASDSEPERRFGISVALDGGAALVGDPWSDDLGTRAGAAYVFRFDGAAWLEEEKLLGASAGPEDIFGFDVALDGDVALIGANEDDDAAINAGAAYVFRRQADAWDEEAKLLHPSAADFDDFGSAVAVEGDVAIVGADADDGPGNSVAGSVIVFRYDGAAWSAVQRFAPPVASPEYEFMGRRCALEGGRVLVSGWQDFPATHSVVYAFDVTDLRLDAPETVAAGSTLSLLTCGGTPLAPVATFLVAVDGAPTLTLLDAGLLSSGGKWSSTLPVPSGALGILASLRSFSADAGGHLASSNVAHVLVE